MQVLVVDARPGLELGLEDLEILLGLDTLHLLVLDLDPLAQVHDRLVTAAH